MGADRDAQLANDLRTGRQRLDRRPRSGGLSLTAITLHPSLAVHPGEWLKSEIVEAHDLSVTAAARLLHVTRQALSTLLNGHADLSPEMAIRFEKVFGISAEAMLRMQLSWDLVQVRRRADDIAVEPPFVAAGRTSGVLTRNAGQISA